MLTKIESSVTGNSGQADGSGALRRRPAVIACLVWLAMLLAGIAAAPQALAVGEGSAVDCVQADEQSGSAFAWGGQGDPAPPALPDRTSLPSLADADEGGDAVNAPDGAGCGVQGRMRSVVPPAGCGGRVAVMVSWEARAPPVGA